VKSNQKLHSPQEIISYMEMCLVEGMSLQHGMNFRGDDSVFLMSMRRGAPYNDSFDKESNVLTYEGHDAARRAGFPDPKSIDQPLHSATRNKKFFDAANEFTLGTRHSPMKVRVYEKLKPGIWVFNGTFGLEKAWLDLVRECP
jgi:hypothetical protein